ncbi:helix-turn-helix domain-containing protein [Haloarcula argentinensis]|uniref:Helix-turn-helix domain-containing protein n=1 Tax=Haloarcula argentinensis TaxID=43776 RepID=A0ABU2F2W9_HALAR|nr:helix-turn-helix domain-containing protein [Haloarcula argentinensis]EMA19129.1 transcription regulator [Haloarcula argentinensis DSM 12282]MDS0254380.1 helix-turn-helix domain-containing protein [Haloarcula argentinensis]
MKYVTLSLWMAPEVRHPMHQFVVEHDGYEASYLLRGNEIGADLQTLLFHVDGFPPEPYRAALEQADTVREYAISTCSDETFYLYVQDSPSATGHDLVNALTRAGLVIVSPVAYRTDGTVGLTLVGPGGTVQQAVETVPDGISVDVREVGEYDSRRLDTGAALTDRQFEAVAAAVDCGYYGNPREGGVDAVADKLGCAPGTAAEHLRKAEAHVMAAILEQRPASMA